MVLRKATPATEAGAAPSAAQRTALSRLIDDATRTGMHLATETMRPSRRGRRLKNSRDGVVMIDGPFAETKELIARLRHRLGGLARRGQPMGRALHRRGRSADEVDVRELE